MRESLRRSLAHTPAKGFEHYAKGSIVLCNHCARPIFRLDLPVSLGDKAGQLAKAFKPLTVPDMLGLASREDVDAGVLALVRSMTMEQVVAHVEKLREMRPGDPMMCPSCGDCFVQVVSVEQNEALDRSYVIELLVVAPQGRGRNAPLRGKRIGHGPGRDWIN